MIERKIEALIRKRLHSDKAIVIIGARQTGKTTAVRQILKDFDHVLILDGDDSFTRNLLDNAGSTEIQNIIGNHQYVFIDEVQRIPNIGLTAKIIVDNMQGVQLILSGSSALEVRNSLSEPLTGRKWEYQLYPISWAELDKSAGYLKSMQQLQLRLIYGMYPEIITHPGDEKERLKQLADSYLYKDLLAFSNIRKPDVLERLLQALALQMGSEISYNELSRLLQVDKNTVKSYIEILEKSFIIFTLGSYSRNLRNELKFAKKIYFWDNGIRNTIINNFNPPELRDDRGMLWENFIISERLKRNNYENPFTKPYFWRTSTQQEVDYLEISDGKLTAYEIKWNINSKSRALESFTKEYDTIIEIINPDNFRDFLI